MSITVGSRLFELRKASKETQDDVAKILGISTSAVGMIERGERNPSYDILIKIADHYDVSTDYILGRIDEKIIDPAHVYVAVDNVLLNKAIEDIKNELKNKILKVLEE